MKPILLAAILCCTADARDSAIDRELAAVLQAAGFTGRIGSKL
jgi:hypothetical protein